MVLKIPEVLIHKVIWLIFVAAYINRWPKSIWCLIPENFHTQGIDLIVSSAAVIWVVTQRFSQITAAEETIDLREAIKISKSEGASKGNTF